jgi:hypothetical protein
MSLSSHLRTQKILIILGLLIFVIGAYLTGGLFPFNIKEVDDDTLHNWWLNALIRDTGAVLAVATIIISGIRSIRAGTGRHWRKLMLCLGYGVCIVFFILNSSARIQTGKILKSYDFSGVIIKIENQLRQNSIPENRRPMLLRRLAESRYLQSGEQIEIINRNNRKETYRPSKETVRFKQQNDRSRKLLGWVKKQAGYSMISWGGVLIFSTLIGLVIPSKGTPGG